VPVERSVGLARPRGSCDPSRARTGTFNPSALTLRTASRGVTLVAVEEHRGGEGAHEVGLRVTTGVDGAWAVVEFRGELDLEEAPAALEALLEGVAAGEEGLVVDLRGVTFLGSTGVRVLLDAKNTAEAAGRRLRVVSGAGRARRLIDLLGLSERLDVVTDTDG